MQGLTSTGLVQAHHALNNTQRDNPLPTLSVSSHPGQVGLPCVTCARLGHIRIPRAMPDHGHVRHAMSCHCQAKPYRLGRCRVLRARSCPNLVALPGPGRSRVATYLPWPCHVFARSRGAGPVGAVALCPGHATTWSHGPVQLIST
jgi:hypothetical protein